MTAFRPITAHFSAAPQISVDDVAYAAQAGFKAIICNRPDHEDGNQVTAEVIAAACKSHDLGFSHIPITGPADPSSIAHMRTALEAANGPVLAYCRSGTRSTNLWALAQASGGADPDALVEAAGGAGYDLHGLVPVLRALKP
ncbi:TIGR01244 family sulfur transferase [Candidatus Phycosocius spiralis]|uniref:TIGR01244 family protein n=1 Tax=Candidatus Phycosocius spiralis TaxID=2815099 RepID=A0ABQ4PVG8_9PROT|nr:TIGR01244 family sulfur transferase [Candidatus Phycosocius spiralis]GIU66879.1 TIGR01244 family protein [Candidatus Phycosocius spiralis]